MVTQLYLVLICGPQDKLSEVEVEEDGKQLGVPVGGVLVVKELLKGIHLLLLQHGQVFEAVPKQGICLHSKSNYLIDEAC